MRKELLLIVDDDPLVIESSTFLLKESFNIISASRRDEARLLLQNLREQPCIALVDLGLPPSPHTPEEGFALIKDLISFNSDIRILVLSGQNKDANIQHAMTIGAADFIAKPSDPETLKQTLQKQIVLINKEQTITNNNQRIIGNSDAINTLKTQIDLYAKTPFPVLIEGESGSGKELIAQELHNKSPQKNQKYLAINCAAFSSELLDSQLFGHKKGAFTGATGDQKGFFEETGKGTLFLDEIGEMPLELQSKLLRILENGEFYRIGETTPRTTETRIIAASNRNLSQMAFSGDFRPDLYHRLSVLSLRSPPVRERGNDKIELMQYFREKTKILPETFKLDDDAQKCWMQYQFPGNVREMRNIVIRLNTKYSGVTVSAKQLKDELESDFTSDFRQTSEKNNIESFFTADISLDEAISNYEKEIIMKALEIAEGNLSQTARILKTNRTTLYGKMQRLGINQ
ncbi:MAG: sigma-54-dependent Fis family transcriptional regulator [Gammaproteobacteria bacterium]|nr:MAG: sigma-54-dependent Fis family transcriptional regulator [Gammaproteobacteria bacterium]